MPALGGPSRIDVHSSGEKASLVVITTPPLRCSAVPRGRPRPGSATGTGGTSSPANDPPARVPEREHPLNRLAGHAHSTEGGQAAQHQRGEAQDLAVAAQPFVPVL